MGRLLAMEEQFSHSYSVSRASAERRGAHSYSLCRDPPLLLSFPWPNGPGRNGPLVLEDISNAHASAPD
jgi:hypothetical protein